MNQGWKTKIIKDMNDDNITAVIRYFSNDTMQFDASEDNESVIDDIYGRTVNLSMYSYSTSPTVESEKSAAKTDSGNFQNTIIIPLYIIIFGSCVIGNLLVILTLAQNKRMRTVTNVYLLNLVSRAHFASDKFKFLISATSQNT